MERGEAILDKKLINEKKFGPGDKVKNNYGRLLTVLVQRENTVYVKEEFRNYDPQHLTIIQTCH